MNIRLLVGVVVLGLVTFACGGTGPRNSGPVESEESSSDTVTALAMCSAMCANGSTVSCSGATCSATDYQGVICDGVETRCPSSCTATLSCESGTISCSGSTCRVISEQISEGVCGAVECDGQMTTCPQLPPGYACY